MTKSIFFIAIAVTTMAFTSCSDTPQGDKATITDTKEVASATGESYIVDTTESRIRFTGNGVGKNHPGTFHISSGSVALAGNQLTGGIFTIDITSLQIEQQEEMFQSKLKPHLLSGDFFDAAKFGTAKFEITKVEPYTASGSDTSIVKGANFSISGNLTLKEDTKNITFPAKLDLDENSLKAKANFNIDRTQWKMNYGNDKTLGDKFISETVNIELYLLAKKQ
jgi:polyisoprenoid-binding protein YceI